MRDQSPLGFELYYKCRAKGNGFDVDANQNNVQYTSTKELHEIDHELCQKERKLLQKNQLITNKKV